VTATSDPSKSPGALAALGHELRTPLTAIIGFADAMRERAFGPLGDKYIECAETIDQAARHMLALVARMTDLGPETGSRPVQAFDASMTLNDVVRLLEAQASACDVTLTSAPPARSMPVEADELALKQIMINLLANALAATPQGGSVEVAVGADGRDLVITVADTGSGPPSDRGDGLGLTLVRALCAAHDGDFSLTNRLPTGALAVARLPVLATG
jgi:signal transduction histidine kinase